MDGCEEMLIEAHPKVRFVQLKQNVGFARANNVGATLAAGRVLLFLNPDTLVKGSALDVLYRTIWQLPDVGVLGCRLLNTDGSLQTSGVMPMPTILNQVLDAAILQRVFRKSKIWQSALTVEGAKSVIPVEGISGACMMIKREQFDRIGGFSDDYFMYAEDLDLCSKAMASGLRNYYVSNASIVHHGGGSTKHARDSFANIMMRESTYRLLRKSRSTRYAQYYRLAMHGVALARLLLIVSVFPLYIANGRIRDWRLTRDKWVGILRWTIGLEGWVKRGGTSVSQAADVSGASAS
jgi:GT2 family glycosyltransferase